MDARKTNLKIAGLAVAAVKIATLGLFLLLGACRAKPELERPSKTDGESAAPVTDGCWRIEGRVIDEAGQPLAGARVAAYGPVGDPAARKVEHELCSSTTGADGRFVLSSLPRSTRYATILASKRDRALDWAFCLQEQTGHVTLELGPAETLEGSVVDEAGRPITGASVGVMLASSPPGFRLLLPWQAGGRLRAKTDRRGRFRFTHLPAEANAAFEISAPGRASICTTVRMNLPFVPGQKGIRIVMPRQGRIEGIVVEKDKAAPLAGVKLLAASSSLGAWSTPDAVESDKDGRFSISGLGGGEYRIRIVGSGQKPPDWLGASGSVVLETGKTSGPVRIEATKGGILEVLVTDIDTGKRIATPGMVSLKVVGKDDRMSPGHWGYVSQGGLARVRVAPGKYTVASVHVPGYSFQPAKAKPTVVEAGKVQRAIASVSSVPPVEGLVHDAGGGPVGGARVRILTFGGLDRGELVTDQEGKFSASMALTPPPRNGSGSHSAGSPRTQGPGSHEGRREGRKARADHA